MATLSVEISSEDARKLAEMAEHEGATPEAIASAAVRARIEADAKWRDEVQAGINELDAGLGMSLDDFEREMDAHMRALRASHG